MNAETYVGEIMTRGVLSIRKDTPLVDAIRAMNLDQLSVIPVVDESGRLCGILSMTDLISLTYRLQADVAILPLVDNTIQRTLLRALTDEGQELQVSRAMTANVQRVFPQDTVIAAARVMTDNLIHHLPVVNQLEEPIGMLSASDIVRTVAYKPEGLLRQGE